MKTEHHAIHKKFQQYGQNAKEWMLKCVLLLPEIDRHRIWEQKGFDSIYEYSAKLAGMGRDQVNESLRVLSKIADKPELQKVVEEKGLNAVKPVITIATKENAGFWAEKAMIMSKNTLEVYVKEIRHQGIGQDLDINLFNADLFDRDGVEVGLPRKPENRENDHQQTIGIPESATGTPSGTISFSEILLLEFTPSKDSKIVPSNDLKSTPSKKIVAMELAPEIIEQLEKLKGQGDWNDLMKEFLELRTKKLEEGKPAPVVTEKRHIPAKIANYIKKRTKGTCSFPRCTKPATINHHTQRFALEKIHDPDRLYGLCKEHERIAHLGLIENEEDISAVWKVKKEANRNAPKFKIDELVGKYRMMAKYRSGIANPL